MSSLLKDGSRWLGWLLLLPVLVLAVAGMFYVRAQKRVAEQAEREKAVLAVTEYQQQLKLWLQYIPEDYRHPEMTREMLESGNSGVFEGDRPLPPEVVSRTAEQCQRLIYEGRFSEAETAVASKDPNLKLASGIPAMAMIYFSEAKMTGNAEKWKSWQANNWPHSLTDLMLEKLDVKDPKTLARIDYLRRLQAGFAGTFEGWIPLSKQGGDRFRVIDEKVLQQNFKSILATIPDRSPAYAMEVLLNDRSIFRESEDVSQAPVFTGFSDGELGVVARLIHPEVLHAAAETQAGWVMALIFIAALAAIIGIVALNQALRRQRELNALQNDFVASVSHELRTPLASMLLVSGRLADGKVGVAAKQDEYFSLLQRECRRLGGLVENLLDHARIEQGKKEYHFEETDVEGLIGATVKAFRPMASERYVTLRAGKVPAFSDEPILDGIQIQQALSNLVDNAIKYAPEGGGTTIQIDVVNAKAEFGIIIRDENETIPRADREAIFDRFFRRGTELRRTTTGTGLGLSIVRHVAEAHGGTVCVRRRYDDKTGNEFVIRLPFVPPGMKEKRTENL